MTPDGKAAAFQFDDGLRWFGTREPPGVELQCLRTEASCGAERWSRAWDEVDALGFVECARAVAWTGWRPDDSRPPEPGEVVAVVGSTQARFDAPRLVAGIQLINGFAHRDATYGDLFLLNARVKTATLEFSDGTTQKITLATETREWQMGARSDRTNDARAGETNASASRLPRGIPGREVPATTRRRDFAPGCKTLEVA